MLGSQAHQKCAVLRHGYRPQCRAEAEDQRQVSPDPEEVSYPFDQDSMKPLGPTDNNHVALRNPSDPIYQAGESISVAVRAGWHNCLPIGHGRAIPELKFLVEQVEVFLQPLWYDVFDYFGRPSAERAVRHLRYSV